MSALVTMASDEQKTTTTMERQPGVDVGLSGKIKETDVVIDKSKFDVSFNVLALRVPKQHSNAVAKMLSRHLFDRPRVRRIVLDPSNEDRRLIILSEKIRDSSLSELPDDKLATLRSITEVEVVQHCVVLGYDYWPVEYILKDVLPAGLEVPSSFETIGHIAHLNIRDELIPYKKLIARVILDKNQPKIRTILNKVGTITNEFRVPTFELLAGDESLVTEVKQHGATFRLDYGLVYWNSRLEFEHKRLVSLFQPKQIVCDMFAGIGPFAVPAAQKGCVVYANDLNPDSVNYLRINADLNKVTRAVHIYNMDAREFMQELVVQRDEPSADERSSDATNEGSTHIDLLHRSQEEDGRARKKGRKMEHFPVVVDEAKPWEHIDHVVMNLPASALEFLDVFQGLISAATWKGSMPRVHCYCFMRANETEKDVIELAEKALDGRIKNPDVWEVRDVAPNKRMLCLSFNLPEEVGFGKCRTGNSVGEQFSRSATVVAGIKKNPFL